MFNLLSSPIKPVNRKGSLHIDQFVWIQNRCLFSAQILWQCSDQMPWSWNRGHCQAQWCGQRRLRPGGCSRHTGQNRNRYSSLEESWLKLQQRLLECSCGFRSRNRYLCFAIYILSIIFAGVTPGTPLNILVCSWWWWAYSQRLSFSS